ncbi:hypothetical protein JOB18_007038 [Solea senegalensis]|uniref:Uncharacterized protein n=1 Tax=Solea senegalensis TaxID=28829 RepID=A0AAV6RQC0_SOLSE|nr:hypothetical protein JOB18_007038 [Solea senegalensis]
MSTHTAGADVTQITAYRKLGACQPTGFGERRNAGELDGSPKQSQASQRGTTLPFLSNISLPPIPHYHPPPPPPSSPLPSLLPDQRPSRDLSHN